MEPYTCTKQIAEAANSCFERKMYNFLRTWVHNHEGNTLLQFTQPLKTYLANDALRDFFLNTRHPIKKLLKNRAIASHLSRGVRDVYFDPVSGDPLLALTEQRIYNLARRMDNEHMHIPFRSVHPNKQTEAGDTADISTYPAESEEIRYNSGNHFSSRPANGIVFDENSKRCTAQSEGNLIIFFKRGFLEDRLQEVKDYTTTLHHAGIKKTHFFLIYSRHSPKEGHFGVSLVIMNPENPDFPQRIIICDTLLKDLPHHPRWWNHFIAEYSQIFGGAVAEIVEDLSHPLQKVNIKGDSPYRHDWDCPYYASSMADALAYLVKNNAELILHGSINEIHDAMKDMMTDYYGHNRIIKNREGIQLVNRIKRWNSGTKMIKNLIAGINRESHYEH